MDNMELYRSIGAVDDELLERSEQAKKPQKLKWVFAAAACLCLIVGTVLAVGLPGKNVGGGLPHVTSNISKIDKDETYPEAPGQLEKVYKSLSELASDASVIVRASVIEQKTEELDGYLQTHTFVRVIKDYAGTAKNSEVFEVIEEGGNEGKVLGGIPQMGLNEEYYLFLQESKGVYYICGAFQGRFIVRDGYVFQQATEDTKLKSYTPISVEAFGEMVGTLVQQKSE